MNMNAQAEPQWEGAVNARVVLGKIYRMGRSEWLTTTGWQQAYAEGVRTVIDLRNPEERHRRHTDPHVDEAAKAGIVIINSPTEEPGHPEFEALAVPYMNHPRMYQENLEFFPHRIAEVFHQIAKAEGKIVLHCSAGRDRTGLIVSMLLKLAKREDLLETQYEAAVRGINEWHKISSYKHPYESYIEDKDLIEPLTQRLEALDEFVDGLSVEEFLVREGITESEIQQILARMGL